MPRMIADLVYRLGLRAPHTKRAEDWRLLPVVREFYQDEINKLLHEYSDQPVDKIRKSSKLQTATSELLVRYGPLVWPQSSTERPWLFHASDPDCRNDLYPKDLYFDNAEDRARIGHVLYKLVIERTIRWRENHRTKTDRASSAFSDASYMPGAATSKRVSSGAYATTLRCIGTGSDHLDATALRNEGVWLGDYDEEKVSVHGESFFNVAKRYAERTNAGKEEDKLKGLHTLGGRKNHKHDEDKAVECACCKILGEPQGQTLTLRHIDFIHEDMLMHKSIQIFPCKLGGKDVFAIVKCDPRRRLRSDKPLWVFWKVNGGYTSDICLTTIPKADLEDADVDASTLAIRPSRTGPETGRRRRNSSRASIRYEDEGSSRLLPHIEVLSDTSDSEAEQTWPSRRGLLDFLTSQPGIETRKSAHRRHSEHAETRKGSKRARVGNATEDDVFYQRTGTTSNGSNAFYPQAPVLPDRSSIVNKHQAAIPFDPDYDVTPGLEGGRIITNGRLSGISDHGDGEPSRSGFFKRFAAQVGQSAQRPLSGPSSAVQPAADDIAADTTAAVTTEHTLSHGRESMDPQNPAAARPPRTRLWLKLRNDTGRTAVVVERTMDVQTVFRLCQQRLARRLAGNSVMALRCFMINAETIEDTDVERNDPDTWDALLGMVPSEENGRLSEVTAWVEV